ncbi:hypothetical protein PUNSTDRAFT_65892 [Punctularia strigosozonata HHB-11173 SS5]|uniref:uncharacterized protein n=1 Tax=Punctularia strigosozonata (strain HHB-11173) TaxID=741275 RepID=UPI00044173C4|nr:uncharacterized protein PUNSTDRAFT_65892 [Punctularia strigosozonata HHB-11173 SS5]EIN09875.1 hypothetical protein PUNSTDRAFT_65892 [Punctularia strigosozonata HHB-11173 SS5]
MSPSNFPPGLDIHPTSSLEGASSFERQFNVDAQADAIRKYGIAGRVWEAAHALFLYLESPPGWEFDPPPSTIGFKSSEPDVLAPRTILELGSGTGVIADALARECSRPAQDIVIATDLPEVCELLEANLHGPESRTSPEGGTVLVRQLAWGNAKHASDILQEVQDLPVSQSTTLTHVVCSDLVYFPELLAPLLRTLLHLTQISVSKSFASSSWADATPLVIVAYKVRSLAKEMPFWQAFGLWFQFYPVLVRHSRSADWSTSFTSADQTFIFIAHRRPDSHSWCIPCHDEELLRGYGARGTDNAKGDDTFEGLLLANICA